MTRYVISCTCLLLDVRMLCSAEKVLTVVLKTVGGTRKTAWNRGEHSGLEAPCQCRVLHPLLCSKQQGMCVFTSCGTSWALAASCTAARRLWLQNTEDGGCAFNKWIAPAPTLGDINRTLQAAEHRLCCWSETNLYFGLRPSSSPPPRCCCCSLLCALA